MSEIQINVKNGEKKRLLTKDKYCEDNIIIIAEEGIDTSDATANASDIVAGKTAYVDGEKVEGTVKVVYGGITQQNVEPVDMGITTGQIQMMYAVTEPTYISPNTGSTILFRTPYSSFGNATASDVVSGKTFTGADGLKVKGTYEGTTYPSAEGTLF